MATINDTTETPEMFNMPLAVSHGINALECNMHANGTLTLEPSQRRGLVRFEPHEAYPLHIQCARRRLTIPVIRCEETTTLPPMLALVLAVIVIRSGSSHFMRYQAALRYA